MPIHHDVLGALPTTTERVFRPIANERLGATSCSAYENVIVPGARIPLHKHAVEEVILCLSGAAECSFDGGAPEPYTAGSVVIIPPHTPHTIRNVGEDHLRQLAFYAGDPRPEWLEDPGSVAEAV